MQCCLQMSLEWHRSKERHHGDLGADVDPPKLTHPSQDTNQLHEIDSHRWLKQWCYILFGGNKGMDFPSLWQEEPLFEIVLEVCLDILNSVLNILGRGQGKILHLDVKDHMTMYVLMIR